MAIRKLKIVFSICAVSFIFIYDIELYLSFDN